MPSKKSINPIYDKKLRYYEQKIIDFIVKSGESKRRTDMESHILAYLLLREGLWLTQDDIRELSQIYYKDDSKAGISKGTISKILNLYEQYHVLKKRKIADKTNAYEYSMSGLLNQLMSTAVGFGIQEIEKYNSFLRMKLKSLEKYEPKTKEEKSLNKIMMGRVQEIIDFFAFHRAIFADDFNSKTTSNSNVVMINSKGANSVENKKHLSVIENEIAKFILDCPMFVIEETRYALPMVYFLTRKQLTQDELRKLTGLSAGLISECINYFLQKRYIELQKIKGIRKRFYSLPSIVFYNYLRYYHRFNSILEQYSQLKEIKDELDANKEELDNLNGFYAIQNRLNEFLKAKPLVDKLTISFKRALDQFNPN